ncbi:MAG: TolC family protein [Armatimonadetes bacterium]|nr:TolC family protein [Armatimonadota bacterium]
MCVGGIAQAQDPLTLTAAQDLAKTTNPLLKASAKDLAAARAARGKMLADFRPMLMLEGVGLSAEGRPGMTPMDRPDMALKFGDTLFAGGVKATWNLFSGGRERSTASIADRMIAMASRRADMVWLDLLEEVRMEFSESLAAQEMLDGLHASLAAATQMEQVTRARFEAGKVPEAFVFGAVADRLKVEQEIAEAEAELAGAIARLVVCCGAEVAGGRVGAWDLPLDAPKSLDEALEIAYKNSPRIAEIKAEAESWRLTARLARQSGVPGVSAFAAADTMAYRGQNMAGGSAVGLWLSWPIGDGGMRKAQAAEAERKAEQLEAIVSVERNTIRAALSTEWAKWKASVKVLDAANGRIQAANEAYRIAKIRFDEGKAIRVEVSEALADQQEATIGLSKGRDYQRRAWIKLQRAMSNLDKPSGSQ